MSWLTDRWGQGGPFGTIAGALQGKQGSINALRNDVGNLVQVGSDVAAPFTGPFAPLVAGAGNALGTGIKPGTNIGDIAKSGGIAAGVAGVGEALGLTPSSGGTGPTADASPADLGLGADAVPSVPLTDPSGVSNVASALGANAPSDVAGGADAASSNVPFTDSMNSAGAEGGGPPNRIPVQQTGIGAGPQPTSALSTAAQASAPSPLASSPVATAANAANNGVPPNNSLLSKVFDTLGGKNANLTGNLLSTIGNAPLNEARTKQAQLENQILQQQIAKYASLDPLRQALAAAFQQRITNPLPVAGNPYYKGTGIAPNPYGGG